MNRLAVVVLNWNGIEDTLLCFKSLKEQTITDFKIVIVDNGSNDTSKGILEKLQESNADNLIVLYNPSNKGFAGGVNTGIAWAIENNLESVVLFNNDATADKDWLKNLIDASIDSSVGITTGLLLHADGKTIDSTGEQYSKWGLPFPRSRKHTISSAPSSGYTFGATGGASLYKIALFKDIGLFDEDFFAYYEDTDISFRAQLAGWKIVYTSEAIAYHKQGATSSKIPGFTVYKTFKNLPLVYLKDVPLQLLFSIGIRFYVAYWLMYIKAVLRGDFIPATKGLLQSIWYGLRALAKRRKVQETRKVPVSYIRSILWPDLPPDQTGIRRLRRFFTGK